MVKMRANPRFLKSHDTFFWFGLVCFPKSSYFPIFCVYFYCYSALSWNFYILNHPSHKKFYPWVLVSSEHLQSWDPPIPHICLLLECHLPFFFTCSFKVRTFFIISVNSQHWITVVSAKSATSSLQLLARPFANVGYHSLWVYSGNFPSLWEMNIYSYFVSHLLWGYLSNYFILSHLLVFTSLQWEVFLTSFCKC